MYNYRIFFYTEVNKGYQSKHRENQAEC